MNGPRGIFRATIAGILGTTALLSGYFLILTAISGRDLALDQFRSFWHYVVALAAGFGIQIALYTSLRRAIHKGDGSGKVLAASGTTSTAAMISCCAHYLTNILPVVGTAGIMALVAQYQTELFWFGLASNAAGILYLGSKVLKFAAAKAGTGPSVQQQA